MYQPGNIDSSSLQGLANSLRLELEKLALQLSQPIDYYALNTLYAQPKRVFEGMVVKADGTTWNPGSGAGVYARVGGAWVKL